MAKQRDSGIGVLSSANLSNNALLFVQSIWHSIDWIICLHFINVVQDERN